MLDVWAEHPGYLFDVRVTPAQRLLLTKAGIEFEVYIEDVQALIDAEASVASTFPSVNSYDWFTEYHEYDDQVDFYRQNCAQNPSLCTWFDSIGQTSQGRSMHAVHLKGTASGNRKIFWDGGIHAREWISSATVAYLFYTLLVEYNANNPDARYILDNFEVVIIPHQNPDGYVYSWETDRMWRKSRRVNAGSTCLGVDLNRNYNVYWGQGGSSANPCSDTYMGTAPASEIETQTHNQYFRRQLSLGTIPLAISYHSYSQLILRPYGHTSANSPDEAEMRALGAVMAEAISDTHGLNYENIKSIELYITTGTTGDWYYNVTSNASFGYTIELRDTGRYGFILPADQIIPQGEEIWAAMVAASQNLD